MQGLPTLLDRPFPWLNLFQNMREVLRKSKPSQIFSLLLEGQLCL